MGARFVTVGLAASLLLTFYTIGGAAPRAGPPPRAAPDDQTCKKDRDCVYLPFICPRCDPCEPTWRPVGNREAAKRIRAEQAAVDCMMPKCPPCSSEANWRGSKPVCKKKRCTLEGQAAYQGCLKKCLQRSATMAVDGKLIEAQCRARCWSTVGARVGPARPPLLGETKEKTRAASADRDCKRDRDCVVEWDPCGYRIPPCGDTWKPAVNRAADKRKRARWASKKPACNPMLGCKKHGRWLGTRAVCIKKQCSIK